MAKKKTFDAKIVDPKHKLTVLLHQSLKDKIIEIQRARGIGTQSEVLRRSVELYEYIISELNRGHDVMIRNGAGELIKIQFL